MSKIIITLYLFLFEMKDKDLKPQWDKDKHDSFIQYTNVRKGTNKYYIPELDEWISGRKLTKRLSEIGLTAKEWFDNNFLYRDSDNNIIYPKCRICGKLLTFFNVVRGYQEAFCSIECNSKWQKSSKSFRESHSKAAKDVWSRENSPYRTENYVNKVSEGLFNYYDRVGRNIYHESRSKEILQLRSYFKMKELHSDELSKFNSPSYRMWLSNWAKISPNAFGGKRGGSAHGKVSKVSLELFDEIKSILVNEYGFNDNDIFYGSNEYKVNFDDKVRDYIGIGRSSASLDFYIRSLNRVIEFNGDYWHKNPSVYMNTDSKDECQVEQDSLSSVDSCEYDMSRSTGIIISLGMKESPLMIWEKDYRMNKNSTVDKCIEYILRGENFRSINDIWNDINNPKFPEDEIVYPMEFYLNNSVA